MGRWLVMLGAGLVGVAFLVVGLVPLVNGSVSFNATEVTIRDIEQRGFPDSAYLQVTGGAVVWPLAEVDRDDGRISEVTAPLASPELAQSWRPGAADGSQLRLVVRFRAEQLEKRWPGMTKLTSLERLPAVTTIVTGETVPFRFLVGNALPGLDPDAMRAMYFERHSLGSSVRKVLWGSLLLALCAAMVVWHRRSPPPPGAPAPPVEAAVELLDVDTD